MNTDYRLSFNVNSYLDFYVLEKNIDNTTNKYLIQVFNYMGVSHLPYTFTENVKLSVMPSQESLPIN